MSVRYLFVCVPVLALAAGCIDDHHAHVEEPHHDEHHDEHHDPILVDRALPPDPSQPPSNASGPGRWVWDPRRAQYIWVQE